MPFYNGGQRRDFRDALLSAFPRRIDLDQMLSFELDENLDEIATGDNHSDVVFFVIQRAEAQGILQELIDAASEYNPGNPQLKEFCQQWSQWQPAPEPVLITPPQIEEDVLSSEKGVDYTRLRDLLKARKWRQADEETLRVMCKAAGREKEGWLNSDSIEKEKFPCTDLRTIDQLWVKYSNDRFGLSVQKRIWESLGRDYDKFGVDVGWYVEETWYEENDVTWSSLAPLGHLPTPPLVSGGLESGFWHFGLCDTFMKRIAKCNI